MFYTINLSPLLVTKLRFLIIILSNYQQCPKPSNEGQKEEKITVVLRAALKNNLFFSENRNGLSVNMVMAYTIIIMCIKPQEFILLIRLTTVIHIFSSVYRAQNPCCVICRSNVVLLHVLSLFHLLVKLLFIIHY